CAEPGRNRSVWKRLCLSSWTVAGMSLGDAEGDDGAAYADEARCGRGISQGADQGHCSWHADRRGGFYAFTIDPPRVRSDRAPNSAQRRAGYGGEWHRES